MELIRGHHNLRARHRGCVATVGAFDGVHRGHQAVISTVRARAAERGLPSTVVVFEPLPREFFAPLQAPARLMSFREKFAVLRSLGVDRVLRLRFDRETASISALDFVRLTLVEGIGVRHFVVGDDLRFGHDRQGDITLLREQGREHGFDVEPVGSVLEDSARISSTRLRELLQQGDFVAAEAMLGRPYLMTGKVVYGRQLGATIGVPTANLELHRLRSPLAGVYVVEVRGIGPGLLRGVANVGTRPTVDDSIKANLEVHILDFAGTIYGRTIDVIFRDRIRCEQKFAGIEALKAQIDRDIAFARGYFADRA